MKRGLLAILWLLVLEGHGQTLPDRPSSAFSFYYANDVTGQTDMYYTNGIAFALTSPVFSASPFNVRWLRQLNAAAAYHTIDFIYEVFTPDLHKPLYTDRPFASVMTLGSKHQYVFDKNKVRLSSEMRIGIIGPATGAGKFQNALHEIMPGADRVEGWESQILNDLAINYIISMDYQLLRNDVLELTVGGAGYVGVPYTQFVPSFMIRLGKMSDTFDYLNSGTRKNWQLYGLGGAASAIKFYDATLQGGLLNPYNTYVLTKITPVILNVQVGLGMTYKAFNLSFSQHMITPEFDGATTYMWGELLLKVVF